MDDHRFDSLVKAMATGTNRRSLFKGLLGLGGAAVVGSALRENQVDAARRPTPTPKPITCPGQQVPVNGVCTCPTSAPDKCGPDCCNAAAVGPNHSECCDNACCFGHCCGGACIPADGCCVDEDCGSGCQTCQDHVCRDDNSQCDGCLVCSNDVCVPEHALCADDDICTDNYCAENGECGLLFRCNNAESCIPDSQICSGFTVDTDYCNYCCSGKSYGGICLSSSSPSCVPDNDPCGGNCHNCCSGKSYASVCLSSSSPSCVPDNDPCGGNCHNCCSGYSYENWCWSCVMTGGNCEDDVNCCQGLWCCERPNGTQSCEEYCL